MMIFILTMGVVITAVLAIQGEYKPTRTQVYIFKPLTTLLIIGIALTQIRPERAAPNALSDPLGRNVGNVALAREQAPRLCFINVEADDALPRFCKGER